MTTRPSTYRGSPCAYGHVKRYKSSRNCVTCSVARARAMRRLATWVRRMERSREVDVDMTC